MLDHLNRRAGRRIFGKVCFEYGVHRIYLADVLQIDIGVYHVLQPHSCELENLADALERIPHLLLESSAGTGLARGVQRIAGHNTAIGRSRTRAGGIRNRTAFVGTVARRYKGDLDRNRSRKFGDTEAGATWRSAQLKEVLVHRVKLAVGRTFVSVAVQEVHVCKDSIAVLETGGSKDLANVLHRLF